MPKTTKNINTTTETFTIAPMDSATDFNTSRMPLDFVNARSGRIARSTRSDRTHPMCDATDVSAISSSVVATMKKSSWFVRSRMYFGNPNAKIFAAHSRVKHAVRQ